MIAAFFQQLGDFGSAIQFLVISGHSAEALAVCLRVV